MGLVGGIIGAVGSIGSAVIGSNAASDAANAQIQAANLASQTELQMFNQTQANEAPYMAAGGNALAELMYGLGIGSPTGTATPGGGTSGAPMQPLYTGPSMQQIMAMQHDGIPGDYQAALATYNKDQAAGYNMTGIPTASPTAAGAAAFNPASNPNIGFGSLTAPFTQAQFQASPGYQYDVNQMMQAVQNSAAAKGGLVSGNTLQALQQNAGGLANQDWYNAQNAYYGRQDQLFNMLQTLAGGGQNAAANLGALGSQVAGQVGNNQIGAGNSAAAGSIAQGQIFGNLLNNQSFLQGIQNMFGGGGGSAWQGMYDASNAGDWSVNPSMMNPQVTPWLPGGI
jgi:hypothetical protein